MTEQANKHKSDRQFKEGDWVYLKVQPYRQVTMAGAHFSKILERRGINQWLKYLQNSRLGKTTRLGKFASPPSFIEGKEGLNRGELMREEMGSVGEDVL